MPSDIILASGSEIRRHLLLNAGVLHSAQAARVDEGAILGALISDGVKPRDIADTLAESKARKVSQRQPQALVIGCDQVLDAGGSILSKPQVLDEAIVHLRQLRGQQHQLLSAAVIFKNGQPQWRFIGKASLYMRQLSDDYINKYVHRNWHSIQHSVGCYKLEEEGARLFSRIQGDYFTILGLPLIELLSYLTETGELPG